MCADRRFEGLEGDSAKVERKPFESGIWGLRFGDAEACAGAVGIFGGPFRMGDLWECEQARKISTYWEQSFLRRACRYLEAAKESAEDCGPESEC